MTNLNVEHGACAQSCLLQRPMFLSADQHLWIYTIQKQYLK